MKLRADKPSALTNPYQSPMLAEIVLGCFLIRKSASVVSDGNGKHLLSEMYADFDSRGTGIRGGNTCTDHLLRGAKPQALSPRREWNISSYRDECPVASSAGATKECVIHWMESREPRERPSWEVSRVTSSVRGRPMSPPK
jgi:hypothetical protein